MKNNRHPELTRNASRSRNKLQLYKDYFVVKGPAAEATDAPQP
jgi:hypothetical protein